MGCEYKDACLLGGAVNYGGVYMHDRNMEDVCNVKIQGCMSMGRGQ